MSNINIKRVVENIRSGTTVYTPVIELIVNAIQAVRERTKEGGSIEIQIIREPQDDLIDKIPSVDGFIVTDDGIGFNNIHRDSFDTLYTSTKMSDGGKGFGRFTLLKYFNTVNIKSRFRNGDNISLRTFSMGLDNDIIVNESVTHSDNPDTGTSVEISGLKKQNSYDKNIDVIARILVEKLLPYFIDPNSECPTIKLIDDNSDFITLNSYLSKDDAKIVEITKSESNLTISGPYGSHNFAIRVFKFYYPRGNSSKISLVAHHREVTDVAIHTYIPEFSDEFYDKGLEKDKDTNFIVKVYAFGDYLDSSVSIERGGFNFVKDGPTLMGPAQSEIERGAAEIAKEAVGSEISGRKERKQKRIQEYVDEQAPWHKSIIQDADFSMLPMNPSPQEIEIHLQKTKLQRELTTRIAVTEILKNENIENIQERVSDIVEKISSTSKNDLIHYVSMRKCVLDLFGKSLETDEGGKYKLESNVHSIIMPTKKDTDTINFEDHNLWILDERLNFTEYVSSDKPLDGGSGDRTDILIYGRRVAFRGDNEASNPITIFEFKRPGRDDFANPSSTEDPVQQLVRYVNSIRDGDYKTPKGREIIVSENTPFYGYVICDFTKKVHEWLKREKDFNRMPDGLGYFKWHDNIKLYVEVLSWTKVLRDAEMRNKVFFHHLGI